MRSPARRSCLRASFACLLGLAVAPPAPARAQSPTHRALILFNEAVIHYNLGQYALAADKFKAAVTANPKLPGPYRYLGLTYRALEKCDLSLLYFNRYLQMQPGSKYEGRIRQEMSHCAAKLGRTSTDVPVGPAQIVLRVAQDGAQVRVDGVLRGATPLMALPVSVGEHTLSLSLDGHLPWAGSVRVAEGEVAIVEVSLKPDPNAHKPATSKVEERGPTGTLRVVAPRNTNLFIDGNLVVLDDSDEVKVAPGTHDIRVVRSGIKPWDATVTIRSNQTTTVVPEVVATPQARSLRRWAWATTGLGVALGLVGGVFGFLENRSFEKIRDYPRTSGNRAALDELEQTRRTQGLAANLLYGFGAAAFGTGIVLFIVTPELETRTPSRAAGALVGARGAF